jgi:hypothetical protein
MTVDDVKVRSASAAHAADSIGTTNRLVVAWQHPHKRVIAPVGLLEHRPDQGYRFRYLQRAEEVAGFQPFLGFPDLRRSYESPRLFPIFAQRIMSPKRPDFPRFLRQLNLDEAATPWEQMARSEGRRTGDTVQVFPIPPVYPDGSTTCRFLVHGIRHVSGGVLPPHLTRGDPLVLRPDRGNPVNPDALFVCSDRGDRLGYVPDLMLDYVHTVQSHGPFDVVVDNVNGPDAPVHLRLLARLDGFVPVGYQPMTGPGWATFVG